MQDSSIPPTKNDYIVGYSGQIQLMKEQCGNTFGDTQRLLANKNRKPIWPAKSINYNWPPRGRDLVWRKEQQQAELQRESSNLSLSVTRPASFQRMSHAVSTHPILFRRAKTKYIAGYQGHIHKIREQVGAPWTEAAHTARWEFQIRHDRPETGKDVLNRNMVRSSTSLSEPSRPVTKKIIPNYGGHVPGERFKHGASFAVLTKSKLF